MSHNEKLKELCPSLDEKCINTVKDHCPDLNNECLNQMDYYLVGRENYDIQSPPEANKYYDEQYLDLGRKLLKHGEWVYNERTKKRCLTYIGDMMKFDLSNTNAFPILTTKKLFHKPMIAELLGFIRGYDNAKDFRDLGCKIWDANANESEHWLKNPNRKGTDDLGRIYGVQARKWKSPDGELDQLKDKIEKIDNRIDDRRLIVTHWNPGELHLMALPPCHMMYIFSIIDDSLHLSLYQRSADYPLGVPFNIASYCLLLKLVAQITGLKCGTFTHFLHNIHIYEDQLELCKEQLRRKPLPSPQLNINERIQSLHDLETWVTLDDFELTNYEHYPAIKYPFAE